MMSKMNVLVLLTVAILPALNGYPLEDDGSLLESTNQEKPNELKVNPLLLSTRTDEQHKSTNSSKDNQSKEDDDSTEPTYIEETYIEVLLPGTPQLNASALVSLLNISDVNNTHSTNSDAGASSEKTNASSSEKIVAPALYSEKNVNDRPTRDASSENDDDSKQKTSSNKFRNAHEQDSADTSAEKANASSSEKIVAPVLYSEKNVNDRPTRDASSENDDDSKEKTNSNKFRNAHEQDSADTSAKKANASSSEKIVAPVLYSEKNVNNRHSRDTSSENDDDSKEKEDLSKEKTNSYTFRNVQEESESDESNNSDESSSKEQVNEQHGLGGQSLAPRLRRSTIGKDKQYSDEKSNESKYGPDNEGVVYVTPRNQNLQDTKKQP